VQDEVLTFLFTDLEGSTRLWESDPTGMRTALADHDRILREAVERHGGVVVKSTGDGALATFARAGDALHAAVAAQTTLWHEPWPTGLELRVRMGLHTSEATPRDGDWFGSDVNRAARVMAVAHGGQILCTGAVREQVHDAFDLVDLGEHRLRDLQANVRLYQANAPGVPHTFPPLRSVDAYPSNLPQELSTFVGRHDQIRAVAERVRAARVVSIVGVGGVGKTRLALQVASEVLPEFPDGVWFCELATVTEADDILEVIANAVAYAPPQGTSLVDGLARFLERKELLLVLDNCEHVVAPVADWVTATIAAAPRISVLATSREGLGVPGEHLSPLSSLDLPADAAPATVLASEAGALFAIRAEEARGEFVVDDTAARAVRELCARLDGIPLAIELAAAQTQFMTPSEIAAHLDERFRLLGGGRRARLERHQTLRAAIDWSFTLLSDDERHLLAAVSVCLGGFELDAVVALAAGAGIERYDAYEILAALVAKSLVERSERDDRTRYRMLEMIRQFAAEQLGPGLDLAAARDHHAVHYLQVATEVLAATATAGALDALERFELETPNILAAARWLADTEQWNSLSAWFAALPFLDPFAWPPFTLDELGTIGAELAARTELGADSGREPAAVFAALQAFFAGDMDGYARMIGVAEELSNGDPSPVTVNQAAISALFTGDIERALALVEDSYTRCRTRSSPAERAWITAQVGMLHTMGDPERGVRAAEESLATARATGSVLVRCYPLVAFVENCSLSDPDRALAAAEECMALDTTRRRAYTVITRARAAAILIGTGDLAKGYALWSEILDASDRDGERAVLAGATALFANALADHDPSLAIELGALAESGAIVSFSAFTTQPRLRELVDTHASAITAARARFDGFGYDDAIAFLRDALSPLTTRG